MSELRDGRYKGQPEIKIYIDEFTVEFRDAMIRAYDMTINNLRDGNPEQIGWYATLMCWDVEEGIFPDGCYWNGKEWDTNASIRYWPIVFESKQAATNYAYDHDPELQ